MGNSLKSKHSRKSHTFKHTKVNFRDYANPPGSPFDKKNPSGKPFAPIVTRLEDTTLKSKEDVKIRSECFYLIHDGLVLFRLVFIWHNSWNIYSHNS